jgi:phospholipase/carboxylesterase
LSEAPASSLIFAGRPAAGEPDGLLILHHGRGSDEHDLLPLADALDPERRLRILTPRAPLRIPDWPGHHWYRVPQVGYPEPESFACAYQELAAFHEEAWTRTGIPPRRTVLGGFSMGTVMSYALALGSGRPVPAGILAFSGFIPTVEHWQADLAERAGVRAYIAHGSNDPVIDIGFAREARARLQAGGLSIDYHESAAAHHIDPAQLPSASDWLTATLPG